jgi:general secretion pathway protein D
MVDTHRLLGAVLVLGVLSGILSCRSASRRSEPPTAVEAPAPITPPVVTAPDPPPPPSRPAVSVGPRPQPASEAAPPSPLAPLPMPPPGITPPPPPQPPAAQRGRMVVLNFDNADVETVVQAASEILGFNYVLAPDVRGKVTVQTSGRIAQEEVFGVLLAILEVHGFTAVKSDNLYKIVRLPDAAARSVPTIVGSAPDTGRQADEIITQIVSVRYTNVNDLRTLLQPLVSQQRGNLIANRESNILIITDTASNVRRLLDIIRLVDVEVILEEVQIIPVQYADATELAQILNQIFGSGRTGPAPSGLPPAPSPPAPTPGPRPSGTPAAPGGAPAAERPPLIIAERRSNSLIVHARRNELEAIRRFVSGIDVSVTGGRRVFIYYAENAKAKDLAATMNAIYGRETAPALPGQPGTLRQPAGEPPPPPQPPPIYGPAGRLGGGPPGGPAALGVAELGFAEGQFRFIADETTNAVIVATTPRTWTEIEETLRQLDRSPRQVLIETLVAEVALTDDTRLGIEWAIRSGRFDLSSVSNLAGSSPPTLQPRPSFGIPSLSPVTALAGFNFFTFATDSFMTALNALAAENKANVLSSPSIMTSENKKAVINVSDSIPIVTSQQLPIGGAVPTGGTTTAVVGTQSIEYRDAGIILTVTPRIGERGTVALDVKQEVNDIGDPEPPTQSRRIIKREAETSVVLVNNQTLVLGGLIKDRRGTVQRGIPVLHKIPILGFLFGFKSEAITKTELLILITPRVIGTAADAARVTETLRQGNPQIEDALRKAPALPPTSPGAIPVPPPPPPPLSP